MSLQPWLRVRPSRIINNQWGSTTKQCRHYAQPADMAAIFQEKSAWDAFPDDVQKLAVYVEHARANNYQIPLLSKAVPGLDQRKAYEIAAAVRALREANGEMVVGRKLGFTNRRLWPEYGVDASNWSYMYRSTLVDFPARSELPGGKEVLANISHMSALHPKIEPEIVFGIAKPVTSSMSDLEILKCVDWIAHGFEVVTSIFPNWKFAAADTTAAFALHGLLLVGPRLSTKTFLARSQSPEGLLENLANFSVELVQNGTIVDTGKGSNVLGSPIYALRHLAELLEKDDINRPLGIGEVVTTGTLTRAFNIKDGDSWSTRLTGIDLPGLDVRFKLISLR